MSIAFTKMEGLGNDFVIVEANSIPENVDFTALAAKVSDRHFGIGADGLIVIAPPSDPSCFDVQFMFFNSDGSRAEMCGNGIRCFALYIQANELLPKSLLGRPFRVETLAGLIQPEVLSLNGSGLSLSGEIRVDMGPPVLTAAEIPFGPLDSEASPASPVLHYPLAVLGETVPVSVVSMGNPHCIVFQDDFSAPLDPACFGPAMEVHPSFPKKTNVEFVEVLSPHHIRVTVWERGCGFTLACGTGACASAVAARLAGKVYPNGPITVTLPGGSLQIDWQMEGADILHGSVAQARPVLMTGPARTVFSGNMLLPDVVSYSGQVPGLVNN